MIKKKKTRAKDKMMRAAGVVQAPAKHPALVAARKEVRSSLVSKYTKYVARYLGRPVAPPFDVAACISNSQANAFKQMPFAEGLSTAEVKEQLAVEFRHGLDRLEVV